MIYSFNKNCNLNMESKKTDDVEDAHIEDHQQPNLPAGDDKQGANEVEQPRKDQKDAGKRTYDAVKRPHVLCMTGVEKQYVEKELIKFIRKYMEVDNKPMPVQGVHKKRGQAFAFLTFESEEQKKKFSDEFYAVMHPQIQNKRINLRECNNHRKTDNLQFR